MWQYCKDRPAVNNNNAIVNFNRDNATDSFKFKTKLEILEPKKVEILVPRKYLSNFWRNSKMSLINCEINLILTWSANCVIVSTDVSNQNASFEITDTKLYVQVVTLSTQDNSRLLQNLKSRFKGKISGNKYLSKPDLLAQNAQLNHLVKPSFQ